MNRFDHEQPGACQAEIVPLLGIFMALAWIVLRAEKPGSGTEKTS